MFLVAALFGCYSTTVQFMRSPSGVTYPPKPPTCHVDFFWTHPDHRYVEVAAVWAYDMGFEQYQKVVGAKACELGGDAVIVFLPLGRQPGIVVKYREAQELAR
jgi:hypothetical protein